MDYHRQEQQFGQPLPPLVDDRMLYCPRPVMAGMSSPYDGFIRQYAGAGCATLPHHLPHHIGGAMPMNLGYQAMSHSQQVAPPVGYLPPPLHMSAAYAGARQYLSSMMSSPPMLVPHSHSGLYPSDSHALTPPMRPTPSAIGHMTIAASTSENKASKDAMLTQPPKLIPASVASRNREVNLSLKPPPLKSHPNKSKVSESPSTLHSPPGCSSQPPYSAGELVDHAQRTHLLTYASSALHAWNRSTENRCSDTPGQTLDLTIRGLLTSKTPTAGTATVTAVKTELTETLSDEIAANVPRPMVDGTTYSADEHKYTCLSCSYCTARVSKMRQHMKAHSNGQLICEDCGKAFIQTCDLERHLNAHLHGRARNTGSKFNMADILLPRESSENFSDLPGMVHRHGDMDASSVVQSEHARDGDVVDSADWPAKSPLAPYSEHALSTQLSLPSMQHSNSCMSSDGDLAIVNCYSVSQSYHDGPTDRDGVTRNVAPGESEIAGRCDESEAGVIATQSLSEAALMREGYQHHMEAVHTSPPAGTVPKAAGGGHTAVAMETTDSESAMMRTSPQMAAPSGERMVLDEVGSVARRSTETTPQQNTDIDNRFPYSGALAQAARDVNERFSTSTSALESSIDEDEERNIASTSGEAGLTQSQNSEGADADTNREKTAVTPAHSSVSQQLIDHLLQSDESPSPSQGNDTNDVLLSPQGALSSLPVGGMFGEPPPMFLPDGSSDTVARPLQFPSADIVSPPPPPLAAGVSLCCTLCNYTGRSQRSLQKHYKAHSMTYKICSYCGKAFERPSDLLRHEERHQMALQRNHTPVIMRGGNFSHKKSNGATGPMGVRAKAKHARVLHCRRCGFATTEHHILALHNKKQHQPSNWFCHTCGQKFISKTSLELHCVVAHPVVPARIDSYMKNVLTDTKVFSCVIGGNNFIQLDDVNNVWFDTLKEQEVPSVSSVTDLQVIVGQTIKHMSDVTASRDFGGNADRPVDLSMYAASHDRDAGTPQDSLLDDSMQMTDVTNNSFDTTSLNDAHPLCPSEATLTRDDMSSPARSVSCDSFAAPDSPSPNTVQVKGDSQPDSASCPPGGDVSKVSVKQREPRQPRVGRYTCDQCSYSSNILRKMTQHKHAHDGRYICKICYKAFIKTSDLTRHWITHGITLDGELKCDTCDYHSSDRESLEVHMKVHYHQRGTYRTRNSGKHRPCTICHEWVYKKAMRKHLLRVHNWPPGGSTVPKLSPAELSKISPVNSAQKSPAGKAKMKKPPSSVLVPKASLGGASLKTPPGGSKRNQSGYTCPECDESFSSSRGIIQHLLIAHPGDPVAPHSGKKQVPSSTLGAVCELCNREFADTIRLARHKAWHTRVSHPSRRQCPICHKQFKTVTYLNQHMQLHSNQKPYECDRCGATFGLHQTLLKHQQRNCSPLRRRVHHVAGEVVGVVTTKDRDHNNYAHTNGASDTMSVTSIK